MTFKIGSGNFTKGYIGVNEISKAYLGSNNVYEVFNGRLFVRAGGNTLYELDQDTLVSIGSYYAGAGTVSGAGGIKDRFFVSSQFTDTLHELDSVTLANLSGGGVSSPGTSPAGIGGIDDRLYHGDSTTDLVYELDPDTLAVLSSASRSDPYGVGGTSDRLYATRSSTIYELDPDTKTAINSKSTPGGWGYGIGGTPNRLFICNYSPAKIYEIDKDTLADLSGGGVNSPASYPSAIGGIK